MNVKTVKFHVSIPFNAFQMKSGAIILSIVEMQAMKQRAHVHPVWIVKKFAMGNWNFQIVAKN